MARAAQRLNLTPSAVSHGLRRLRRLLHDPLFLKTPSGVKPTDRARALAGPVAEVLTRVAGSFQRQDHSIRKPRNAAYRSVRRMRWRHLSRTFGCLPGTRGAEYRHPASAAHAATSRQSRRARSADHSDGDRRATARYCGSADRPATTSLRRAAALRGGLRHCHAKGASAGTQAEPRGVPGRPAHARFGYRRCTGSRGCQVGRERTFAACRADGAEFHDGAGAAGRERSDCDFATSPGRAPCRAFQSGYARCAAFLDADPVRVIASQAAMADAGITWLFETIALHRPAHQLRRYPASQMNLFGR